MCLCASVNGSHHPADSPEDVLVSCPPGDIFAYFMNSLTFNVSTTGSYMKGGGERGERLILTKELPTESICIQKIPLIDSVGFNVAGSTGNVRYPPRTDSWEASPLKKALFEHYQIQEHVLLVSLIKFDPPLSLAGGCFKAAGCEGF